MLRREGHICASVVDGMKEVESRNTLENDTKRNNFCTIINRSTRVDSGSHTRLTSLRARSTNITCSARSFNELRSSSANASSSSFVFQFISSALHLSSLQSFLFFFFFFLSPLIPFSFLHASCSFLNSFSFISFPSLPAAP